jgi:serine phosphatase RsbU (regulator of sigma subunit)
MLSPSDILRGKILIVDDQEANVLVLERMLRGAGYVSVDCTRDPREVRDLHLKNHYDLILLDILMPGMDGFQVMEGLKEIETGGYLPVLVLTAQPDHKLRALKTGARDFVSKPFDLAEVLVRVHNMLEVRLLNQEERRRSEQELVLAQQTQESLLPRIVPQFGSFRIQAFSQPTRYVGGDFYDFQQRSSGEWMGVLADVSGKGMPAALLSSMVLGALTMEFRAGTPPEETLNRLNQLLLDKSLSFQFVTLFLFLMTAPGRGQFISAGHNTAYLFRSATGQIEELKASGAILGYFPTISFDYGALEFSQGDVLVVYSDGLTDAANGAHEMFGEEQLLEIIRRQAPAGGSALKQTILKAIGEFTMGMPQTDDITFLIVERSGAV